MSFPLGKDVLFARVRKLKTYQNLPKKEDNILYFVDETNEIYKGDELYSSGNIVCTYPNRCSFPKVGESIKLYISKKTNHLFRWDPNDMTYVRIDDIVADLSKIVDNKSIVIRDGVMLISGFEEVNSAGMQLRSVKNRCTGEISLEWFMPSTDKVEGLSSIVGQLVTDFSDVTKLLYGDPDTGAPGIAARLTDVETKVINAIKLGDNEDSIPVEGNTVRIPIANDGLGVVKSSVEDNKVSVNEHGDMELNSLEASKLFIGNTALILNGGSSL